MILKSKQINNLYSLTIFNKKQHGHVTETVYSKRDKQSNEVSKSSADILFYHNRHCIKSRFKIDSI